MSLNNKISDYLREKKVSQGKLAEELKVSPASLNRMLKSDDLKMSTYIKICSFLNVPVTKFFEGSEHIRSEKIKWYEYEIDMAKKRIVELEEMVADKKMIIANHEKNDIERVMRLTKEVIEEKYSYFTEPVKEYVIKFVIDGLKDTFKMYTGYFTKDKKDIIESIEVFIQYEYNKESWPKDFVPTKNRI